MAPDAAALSSMKPTPTGTRQDADAQGFGFEKGDLAALATPPKFDNLDDEKRYLKERLALACRIFAQYGLDHHVVRSPFLALHSDNFEQTVAPRHSKAGKAPLESHGCGR